MYILTYLSDSHNGIYYQRYCSEFTTANFKEFLKLSPVYIDDLCMWDDTSFKDYVDSHAFVDKIWKNKKPVEFFIFIDEDEYTHNVDIVKVEALNDCQ